MKEEIDRIRYETLGWMYAYACNALDEGKDIRQTEVPEIVEQAKKDLEWDDKS